MHTDATDPTPPAPSRGDVSDDTLDRAGVSRTAVRATDSFLALMGAMRDHLRATAELLEMSPPLLLTLRMLGEPLAQRDIAASIGCDPSYVTTLVDRLEELGAVQRTPDPGDRRVNRIVLTAEGERLRRDVVVGLLRDLPLARGLDEDELRQLHGLLDRALSALAAEDSA